MKKLGELYLVLALVVLMFVRPVASGKWFGSVVVAGVFVTWMDTMYCVWKDNSVNNIKEKVRYGTIFTFMGAIGFLLLVLIIVNIVKEIDWLNNPIFLDEVTLIALIICVSQRSFIRLLSNIIKKGKKWYKE